MRDTPAPSVNSAYVSFTYQEISMNTAPALEVVRTTESQACGHECPVSSTTWIIRSKHKPTGAELLACLGMSSDDAYCLSARCRPAKRTAFFYTRVTCTDM